MGKSQSKKSYSDKSTILLLQSLIISVVPECVRPNIPKTNKLIETPLSLIKVTYIPKRKRLTLINLMTLKRPLLKSSLRRSSDCLGVLCFYKQNDFDGWPATPTVKGWTKEECPCSKAPVGVLNIRRTNLMNNELTQKLGLKWFCVFLFAFGTKTKPLLTLLVPGI